LQGLLCRLVSEGDLTIVGGEAGLAREVSYPFIVTDEKDTDARGEKLLIHDFPPSQNYFPYQLISRLRTRGAIALFTHEGMIPSYSWGKAADQESFPTLITAMDLRRLVGILHGLIREHCEGVKVIHGNLVAIAGQGVLLTGPSGVGKTTCTLRLVERGHRWVADDVVVISRSPEGILIGRPHEQIKGYLYVRGKGMIYLSQHTIAAQAPLSAWVELTKGNLRGERDDALCGVPLPRIRVGAGDIDELVRRIEKLVN